LTKTTWEQFEKFAKEEIKFLPKNETITIYPTPEPVQQEIDGKFGKQMMYVVGTNIGAVALNRAQFLKVCSMLALSNYTTPIRFTKA
jgi:hypothetical protein